MLGSKLTIIVVSIFILAFSMSGCAVLKNAPVVELPSSRLTCNANPEFVDGDLRTVGEFRAHGAIRQLYYIEAKVGAVTNLGDSTTTHDGSLKTETLIKLDKPTYVSYIEIYAGSDIRKIALDSTIEDKSPNWANSFVPVKDKRYTNIKDRQMKRFYIRQEVLYLRITTDGIEDRRYRKGIASTDPNFSHEYVTPLKGAYIREVKFYEQK